MAVTLSPADRCLLISLDDTGREKRGKSSGWQLDSCHLGLPGSVASPSPRAVALLANQEIEKRKLDTFFRDWLERYPAAEIKRLL